MQGERMRCVKWDRCELIFMGLNGLVIGKSSLNGRNRLAKLFLLEKKEMVDKFPK